MSYPFTTAGGVTSVAWGQITGVLSDQTDLQSALDSKQGTGGGALDVTSNDFWASLSGQPAVYWTGSVWEPETPPISEFYLITTGSWAEDLRPTRMEVTINSGEDLGGDYSGAQLMVKDMLGGRISHPDGTPVGFGGWEETKVVVLDLDFQGGDRGDIYTLEVYDLYGSAMVISKIELFS